MSFYDFTPAWMRLSPSESFSRGLRASSEAVIAPLRAEAMRQGIKENAIQIGLGALELKQRQARADLQMEAIPLDRERMERDAQTDRMRFDSQVAEMERSKEEAPAFSQWLSSPRSWRNEHPWDGQSSYFRTQAMAQEKLDATNDLREETHRLAIDSAKARAEQAKLRLQFQIESQKAVAQRLKDAQAQREAPPQTYTDPVTKARFIRGEHGWSRITAEPSITPNQQAKVLERISILEKQAAEPSTPAPVKKALLDAVSELRGMLPPRETSAEPPTGSTEKTTQKPEESSPPAASKTSWGDWWKTKAREIVKSAAQGVKDAAGTGGGQKRYRWVGGENGHLELENGNNR